MPVDLLRQSLEDGEEPVKAVRDFLNHPDNTKKCNDKRSAVEFATDVREEFAYFVRYKPGSVGNYQHDLVDFSLPILERNLHKDRLALEILNIVIAEWLEAKDVEIPVSIKLLAARISRGEFNPKYMPKETAANYFRDLQFFQAANVLRTFGYKVSSEEGRNINTNAFSVIAKGATTPRHTVTFDAVRKAYKKMNKRFGVRKSSKS